MARTKFLSAALTAATTAYAIPATVYVTIGFIDGSSPWINAGGDAAMMSGVMNDVIDKAKEAIDKIVPGAGLMRKAPLQ